MTTWEVWASGVLKGIGAPITSQTVDALWAWSGAESLPRDRMSWCNPLNTTQPWAGAVNMNSVGVKRYASVSDGISATVTTLLNGYYPVILANLRGAVARANWDNACPNLGTWGTGCGWLQADYGPVPTNLGEDMAIQDDVTEILELLRTGHKVKGGELHPRWIFTELEAIKIGITAPAPTPAPDLAQLKVDVAGIKAAVAAIRIVVDKIDRGE